MDIELRPYQEECIKLILNAYEQDPHGTELLVLPTGAGKTICFVQVISELSKKYGLNALVVAHRDELLDQAADKYRMMKPDAIIGKVGSGRHEYGGEVTVASVATISRPEHIKRLKQFGYDLVIIDEAHHVAANGYQAVLDALQDSFKLYVTATSERLDSKPIIDKAPLYLASIIDMIRDGFLCDVKAIAIKTHISLDELHTQAGDYKQDELEQAIDTPARNNRVVDAYREHADGRRTLCFGVTVAHAAHLTQAFTLQGVSAALVTGETPLEARRAIYADLRSGKVKIICNVLVLTEGFDEPKIECIIMARPTQSRALYVQCIGRGLRLAPAKENCIILDLTDNCLKHRLEPQSLKKILNKNIKDDESLIEAIEREEQENAEHEVRIRKLKDRRDKDIKVDLLEKLIWQERTDGMFILEVGPMKHRIALVPCKDGYEGNYAVWARLAPDFEGQKWLDNAPLDWCQSFSEKKARMLLADRDAVKLVDRNAPWRNQPASEKQLELLRKFRVPFVPELTKGQAADILDPIFEKLQKRREAQERKAI